MNIGKKTFLTQQDAEFTLKITKTSFQADGWHRWKKTLTKKCSVIFSIDFLTKFDKFLVKDSFLLSLHILFSAK